MQREKIFSLTPRKDREWKTLPNSRFLFPDGYFLSLCAWPLEIPCGEKQEIQIQFPGLDQAVPGLIAPEKGLPP